MKKFGLSKNERIRLRNEVQTVFDQGQALTYGPFKIFYKENSRPYSRFALLINKRYGTAAERNKAKRHMRELFRNNKEKILKKIDIIFYIRNEFKGLSFEEKKKCFLDLVHRIKP